MGQSPPSFPRRSWLLHSLETTIAATAAAIFYPVGRFLWPRRATTSGAAEMVAPYRAGELRPNPEGKWPPPFNFGGKPCLLVRTPQGEIKAYNAVCSHLACTVEYRPAESDIFCNCHDGIFDLNGHNVSGPPPRPLEQYKVTLRGTPGQEEIIVSRST